MSDYPLEIRGLEKQITALSDALAKLGSADDFKHLIQIIHRPGWTTPAELAFTVAILEHMQTHVQALSSLKGRFMEAAQAVGARQAA